MSNRKYIASILLIAATLMWGLSYSIQSISASSLGTFTIVFFKGVGGLFVFPYLIIKKIKLDKQTIIGGFLIGIVAFLGLVFQQMGIELSTVSKASFITSLYIIIVPILEIFNGKKPAKKLFLAILIALIGLYLLCFSGNYSFNVGDVLLLLCSLFFAFQIMFIDKYSRIKDSLALTFVSQGTISVLAFIVMLIKESPNFEVLATQILPILYMVFIAGMIATTIQIVFQKDCGPTLASLLMSFESVFGAIGGWLILNQVLSIKEIVGCILVFIAILIAE